jgi:hypothetical protein
MMEYVILAIAIICIFLSKAIFHAAHAEPVFYLMVGMALSQVVRDLQYRREKRRLADARR